MSESSGVVGIELASRDPAALSKFYCDVLEFENMGRASDGFDSNGKPTFELRLGEASLFVRHADGRPIPSDSRSNDRWFRHVAIVVSSVREACERLEGSVATISCEPQTLPAWNPDAGAIEALYFRDPDGHPVELIAFPRGKGKTIWQRPSARCFRGIDHTAIVVDDTPRTVPFYRDCLGLHLTGTSHNFGVEQERLSDVAGARVLVTTFEGRGSCGVELLEYIAPRDGRPLPPNTTPQDLWFAATCIAGPCEAGVTGDLVRDPAGAFVRILAPR